MTFANGLARRLDLGRRHVVVAILLTITCTVAAIGFAAASKARTKDFVGLGLSTSSADATGAIRLGLAVQNGTAAPQRGSIRVQPVNPASAPGLQPIVVDVTSPAHGEVVIDVRSAAGCGVRLDVLLQTALGDRSLIVFVPCI